MYSVVLMAAMTAGTATPAWHHCGGWCGHGGHHGGCYGGCYGGGYDGSGVYGGCYGCWGGYSNWSFGCTPPLAAAAPGGYGMMGGAAAPGMGQSSEELGKPTPNKNGEKETRTPARAKLLVEVPANSRLFIDDMLVKVPAGVHTLLTPTLEPGQAYFYTMRIERRREGQPVTETRRIIVHAGQVARVEFKEREAESVRTVQAK